MTSAPKPTSSSDDGAGTPPARWAPDPSGRHIQRYWDGARWTTFVAGAAGGAPGQDPLDAEARWPAPNGGAATGPPRPLDEHPLPTITGDAATEAVAVAGVSNGSADRSDRQRRRWKVAAVLGALALAGAAAALVLGGTLGSSGRDRTSQHRRAALPPAVTHGSGHVTVGAASATTSPPTVAPKLIDPLFDPCGLLSAPDIGRVTGLAVGSAQRIPNGCAWRGTKALASPTEQDRAALHGQEGVVVNFLPASEPRHSVLCTASIPGITAPAGICTTADGSQYAMYQHRTATIQVFVRTNQRVSQAQLEQLALVAFSHTAS